MADLELQELGQDLQGVLMAVGSFFENRLRNFSPQGSVDNVAASGVLMCKTSQIQDFVLVEH